MFCRNCGKELENDSRFCAFCGAQLWIDDIERGILGEETEKNLIAITSDSKPRKRVLGFWAVVGIIAILTLAVCWASGTTRKNEEMMDIRDSYEENFESDMELWKEALNTMSSGEVQYTRKDIMKERCYVTDVYEYSLFTKKFTVNFFCNRNLFGDWNIGTTTSTDTQLKSDIILGTWYTTDENGDPLKVTFDSYGTNGELRCCSYVPYHDLYTNIFGETVDRGVLTAGYVGDVEIVQEEDRIVLSQEAPEEVAIRPDGLYYGNYRLSKSN